MGPTSLRPSKMEKGSLILSVELQLLKLWIRTQTSINPVHVGRLQMHTSENFKLETCSKDHYTCNHHQEDIIIRCIHFPPTFVSNILIDIAFNNIALILYVSFSLS